MLLGLKGSNHRGDLESHGVQLVVVVGQLLDSPLELSHLGDLQLALASFIVRNDDLVSESLNFLVAGLLVGLGLGKLDFDTLEESELLLASRDSGSQLCLLLIERGQLSSESLELIVISFDVLDSRQNGLTGLLAHCKFLLGGVEGTLESGEVCGAFVVRSGPLASQDVDLLKQTVPVSDLSLQLFESALEVAQVGVGLSELGEVVVAAVELSFQGGD